MVLTLPAVVYCWGYDRFALLVPSGIVNGSLLNSMEETEHQRTIEELMAKNYALLEELSQCNADKEFVWNLWRRLQSSQPEVTSVVSMVIAREKEKSEIKDKKVLEILQMKDEKIKELKERILSADDEAHYSKTRYHDLLIENEELKQQIDQRQAEFSAKEKEVKDEKSYLSSLLKAHQAQKELDDERAKENRNSLEEENNQLKAQIGELSGEKLKLATAIEANASLEEKITSLENKVEDLTAKSADIQSKYDEAEGKLNEKEKLTQDQLTSLQKQSEKISELENEIMNLNQTLEHSEESYREASVELSKQAIVIQQLQTLQNDNQRTSVERDKKYKKELASLQTLVADLQAQCSLYLEKEINLQKDIEKLKENSITQKEEISVKNIIIRELKDALRDGIQSEVTRRNDRVPEFSAGDRDSLRKEGTKTDWSKSKSLRDQYTNQYKGDKEENKEEFKEKTREFECGNTTNQERVEDGLNKVGMLRELEAKLTHRRQTIDELKKLLELKEAELVETRRGHSQRQQRYRMLKETYQLILEQLKTYETSGAEDSQIPNIVRPDERDLRHLDSDQVWKELAYYKKEYEALAKERHDVLEEIDLLRVQHANNVASIQELRVLLSEEREENIQAWNKIEAEKETVHAAQREVERLEDQMESWQDKALQGQKIANEFDEENQLLKQEIKNLQGQNKALSMEFSSLKEEVDRFKEHYDGEISKERDKGRKSLEKIQEDELATETEMETNTKSINEQHAKQQKESLSVYDAQVRRIADRILAISPKRAEESITTTRVTQGTQTDVVPRFIDSGINVNLDSENMSSLDEEEALDMTVSSKNTRVAKVGGVGRKIAQQTPQPRKVLKKTPGRNEWASMKQRILSLTQEVSALRQSKDKAVKAASQHKENSENLQMECNSLLQKLQVSKNSVQHLTEALKKGQQEKDLLVVQLNERRERQSNVLSISEWKHLEEQLRLATAECTRLSVSVRTLDSENEQLKVRLKYVQGNTARLENAISQKKRLLDEAKTKTKDAEEKAKGDLETVKNLEEKLSQSREREKISKLRIETLEHRVESESREIQKCKQQLLYHQEQLKKTSQQLHRY